MPVGMVCGSLRSFAFPDGRQLLCARCSRTFLGVLVGLLGPVCASAADTLLYSTTPIMLVMIAFSAFWAFDGANSFRICYWGLTPRLSNQPIF
jgi:uncharacterized membrane protein